MIATTRSPYLDLGFHHQTPPRIISEIKKPTPAWPKDNMRPRISGELLCWLPSENRWRSRRVSVRCGQLQVGSSNSNGIGSGESCPRLALRRLNLTQGPNVHSFALRKTQDAPPVLTLQASNQREFDMWVKTIAIELIRQTPLDAIKYLDILTLTPQVQSTPKPETNSTATAAAATPCTTTTANDNCCDINNPSNVPVDVVDGPPKHIFRPKCLNFNNLDENQNYCNPKMLPEPVNVAISLPPIYSKIPEEKFLSLNMPIAKITQKIDPDDEQTVELLLKKCQNADSYVPVKEKLKLFESLCRLGRIDNIEDHNTISSKYSTKRTRSLHDLSNSEYTVPISTGVKQICQYFETKNDENKEKETMKYNTIARGNRTSFGPVKTIISRKYSIQKNF